MKKQKTVMTTGQFNRLRSELLAHKAGPVGTHLSHDDFIYFAMGEVTSEEIVKIERHLASCSGCLAEMERLVETAEAWHGPRGEERIKRMQAEILRKVSASSRQAKPSASPPASPYSMPGGIMLLPDLSIYDARAAAAMAPIDDQALGGALRWRIVEDEEKNLIVRFSSQAPALCGTQLKLSAGHWWRVIAIARVAPNQVGAETVITRKEREQLRADTALRLDFFIEDLYAESEG